MPPTIPTAALLFGDGKTVMLGLKNEREWLGFCSHVLRQPALAEDDRFRGNAQRVAQRETLRPLIVGALAALSYEQVVQRLEAAQIANAELREMAGLGAVPALGQHTDAVLTEMGVSAAETAELRAAAVI